MTSVGPIFELTGGRVVFDQAVVLNGVDFQLSPGEFVALLGANGSGKTTLVRALMGLVPLEAGEVRVFGVPLAKFRQWFRIGYVPQRAAGLTGTPASVEEVVVSGRAGRARRLRRYREEDRAAAARAIETVGLSEIASNPLGRLSGGQQQRALIARALASEPDVLLLDEPTSGVDLEHQEALASTLGDLNRKGKTVLLVAHALGAMEDLITREVVLQAGRVSYEGPHLPHHVHAEHVHHPEVVQEHTPLDRAVGRE